MDGELVLIPLMGIMVPITAIVGGVILAYHALKQRARKEELEHQERIMAMEKGVPLPPAPVAPIKRKNPYFWGFVFIGLGLAISVSLWIEGEGEWVWGFGFFCIGSAMLLAHWVHNRQLRKDTEYVRNGSNHPSANGGTSQ